MAERLKRNDCQQQDRKGHQGRHPSAPEQQDYFNNKLNYIPREVLRGREVWQIGRQDKPLSSPPKQPRQENMQQQPLQQLQGEPRNQELDFDIFLDQKERPPQIVKVDFKKTFAPGRKTQPIHWSELIVREQEGGVDSKPRGLATNSQFAYFKRNTEPQIEDIFQNSNFSYYLQRLRHELYNRNIENSAAHKLNPETQTPTPIKTTSSPPNIPSSPPNIASSPPNIASSAVKTVPCPLRKTFLPKSPKPYCSPWVMELSQRLHDGNFRSEKLWAGHCKLSDKAKREYFQELIGESQFAGKVLTPLQLEAFFQHLSHSEPIPYWRSRIVSQEMSRMKRVHEYEKIWRSIPDSG